ncbi:hypothetical protein K503DRAFT_776781 [Rhizopogon vinicolor AM-OR11-026]|uniref:F-box domain-containing protein n=1 Tax=Rhizopogon vinicolor AM-OR11-026 TaxID=1314800 RepID=A0A1B7MI89_9AGAM|nr:hypothetical protein K503DRAFT_776781 [Rhizopogon vinicolor AM-OR11-026]
MHAIEVKANSEVKLCPASEIIGALQNILASSQPIIPDIEIPYSRTRFNSNTNLSGSESVIGQEQSTGTIITECQQQLDAVLHEISDLDIVMDKIEHLRQQLMEKRDRITQSMTLHKGLSSALPRFPTEVLCQIFVYCLPETDYPEMSPELAPILLTRICWRWREIAVGMPSLWRRLSVDVRSRKHQLAAGFCYDLWLKRSRGRPLSLAIRYRDSDETKVRSLLQPYMKQVSSIVFPNATVYQFLALNLPALQELAIENIYCDDAQSIVRLPYTLRSLRLKGGYGLNFQQSYSSNPIWAQLTNLEISVNNAYTFLRLLPLCLNLSSAMLILPPYDNDVQPDLDPCMHTKLQSLSISRCYNVTFPHSYSYLFNGLSLPNLRVLHWDAYGTWPHEEFKAFLARSNCPLERLTFGRKAMRVETVEYIALIPSLEIAVESNLLG